MSNITIFALDRASLLGDLQILVRDRELEYGGK